MKRIVVFLFLLTAVATAGVQVEERTYGYKDKYVIIEGRLPAFLDGDSYISTGAVDKFEIMDEFIRMQSRRYFLEEGGKGPSSFILRSDFSESANNTEIESFLVKTYYYMGGDHGMIMETPYNFYDGREITLKDIFREGVNYRRLLKNNIEEIIIEENPSLFYENISIQEEDDFKFYFKDDLLIVIFNPYEIGPFSSGIPAFSIPLKDLSDYLILPGSEKQQ